MDWFAGDTSAYWREASDRLSRRWSTNRLRCATEKWWRHVTYRAMSRYCWCLGSTPRGCEKWDRRQSRGDWRSRKQGRARHMDWNEATVGREQECSTDYQHCRKWRWWFQSIDSIRWTEDSGSGSECCWMVWSLLSNDVRRKSKRFFLLWFDVVICFKDQSNIAVTQSHSAKGKKTTFPACYFSRKIIFACGFSRRK